MRDAAIGNGTPVLDLSGTAKAASRSGKKDAAGKTGEFEDALGRARNGDPSAAERRRDSRFDIKGAQPDRQATADESVGEAGMADIAQDAPKPAARTGARPVIDIRTALGRADAEKTEIADGDFPLQRTPGDRKAAQDERGSVKADRLRGADKSADLAASARRDDSKDVKDVRRSHDDIRLREKDADRTVKFRRDIERAAVADARKDAAEAADTVTTDALSLLQNATATAPQASAGSRSPDQPQQQVSKGSVVAEKQAPVAGAQMMALQMQPVAPAKAEMSVQMAVPGVTAISAKVETPVQTAMLAKADIPAQTAKADMPVKTAMPATEAPAEVELPMKMATPPAAAEILAATQAIPRMEMPGKVDEPALDAGMPSMSPDGVDTVDVDVDASEVRPSHVAKGDDDRIFRFSRADGRGQTLDMTIGGPDRNESPRNLPVENVTVLDSRRYLALSPNTATIAGALAADPEWTGAMQPGAALSNAASQASTGKVVNTLKIQIHPMTLGAVTATMRLAGDELTIDLQVETTAAYRQLNDDQRGLVESLRAQGFSVDQVTVTLVSTPDRADTAAMQGNGQQNAATGQQTAQDGGASARRDDRHASGQQNHRGGSSRGQEPQNGDPAAAGGRPDHLYL